MHTSPKIYLLSIMLLTSCNTFSFFNYDAGGSISGTIEKSGGTLIQDGQSYALSSIAITNTTFNGTGLLEAPNIVIKTENWNFTGTIRCHGTCVIYTPKPVDQSKIKKEGPGTFIFTNDLNAFNQNVNKLKSQFSVEPVKNFVLEYPQHHPIQLGVLAIIATVGAVIYCNDFFNKK